MVLPDVTTYPLRLASPLALFFAAFFAAPLVALLGLSLQGADGHLGLSQYAAFLGDGFSLGVLLGTLWLGLKVTMACLVLGLPLALVATRAGGWVRGLVILAVLTPLLTSVVIRTFAWIVILGRQGVVNSVLSSLGLIETPLRMLYAEGGLVAALAQVQMPLMVLPLMTALSRIDPSLWDASEALGAGRWRTFVRVTLPLCLPGLIAGAVLTFAAAISGFITQSLIGGGQMLFMPGYIYQQAIALQNWPFAAAMSVIFLVAVLAVVLAFNALGRLARGYAQT
ncbi:ABC transporter permease [Methylobacterium currus]|uniref:ABC transporter permease n=1 Tax=Methylobacterium currus TaxID=2051553 RepID=A0A2R4WH93_9HYPH|nr:ABC transporter permease [Methylobacterium currus]AWB20903.1 ABC transporter permease [Methylobacterium currus]UHC14262.1 ABC transporter permease [Methylobacterium currus]